MLRREMARLTRPQAEECLLDLGSGTGDLANEILRKFPSKHHAADFSLEMMTATNNWQDIKRAAADALHLPFADASFDLVTSGYLVRNVIDLDTALSEQFRVLKPGGRVLILDMTKPRSNLLAPDQLFCKDHPFTGWTFQPQPHRVHLPDPIHAELCYG